MVVSGEAITPPQSAAAPALPEPGDIRSWVMMSWFGMSCLFALLARGAARPLSDPDTWWHLRAGREFWTDWSLAEAGQFSDLATEQWTARDWIPQLAAAKVEQLFGLPGVAWLVGLGYIAVAVALWFAVRRFADPLPAAVSVTIGVAGAAMSLSARPQILSFALVALFVAWWLETVDDLKPRWFLVPVTVLWSCSHGMWFVGVVIGLLAIGGLALERRAPGKALLRLLAIPVCSMLLTAVTPAGTGVALSLFEDSSARDYVSEWQPVSILSNPSAAVAAIAVAVIASCYMWWGKTRWSRLLLLFLAAGWIVMSGRSVALGAVMLAPLLGEALQRLLGRSATIAGLRERVLIVVSALVALAALAVATPHTSDRPMGYPTAMSPRFEAWPQGTVVFNEYDLGGWLVWRHSQLTVVVDGNTPGYSSEHLRQYFGAYMMEPGWYQFIANTRTNFALLNRDSPVANGLRLRGWKELDRHGEHVLLQRQNTR
jgi:hypothetical protein